MRLSLMCQLLTATVSVLALSACASTSSNNFGNYHVSNDAVNVDNIPKIYTLENFNLTLNQKVANPAYPDEKALEAMFVKKINQQLASQNKLSQGNGMELDITMQYKRAFEGEMFGYSKVYAGNRCEYTATLSFDGKNVASFSDEAITRTSMIDQQKALFQNFKRIAEIATLSGDQGSEERDINTCTQRIVERLPK